ncbi:MAG: hypothetical protein KHX49_02240 [Lachnospiraceae bacterium]|nr:hypothetical protein [Lachnospiraceae bacterium]
MELYKVDGKTGDTSNLPLLLAVWLASATGIIGLALYYWKTRNTRKKQRGKKVGMFLILSILMVGLPAGNAQAAEEKIENLYEERQYTTQNPDSDEAEKLFEKELERDGVTYRLSEIQTEVIDEDGGSAGSHLEIAGTPMLKEKAEEQKPEDVIQLDGVDYQLQESTLEETTIKAHEETVEETVTYEEVEAKDIIPSQIPVTVTDDATGQRMEAMASIASQEFSEERWEDNFSFTVTFHEYGIDGYWLGDQVFMLDEENLDFTGYEELLLSLIEAEPENYRIHNAEWTGEPYEDSEGIICRDAVVSGEKLVRDCVITYRGTAVFEEELGVRYLASYKPKESAEDGTIVLLRRVWLEAAGILVILVVGISMESIQEGQGFLRLTIFSVIGLSIHFIYSIWFILKRMYSVIEGEVIEINSRKLQRKWVEIIVRTKDDEQEKLVIPAEYKIAKRKNYRFYSKNGCFIAVEEMI